MEYTNIEKVIEIHKAIELVKETRRTLVSSLQAKKTCKLDGATNNTIKEICSRFADLENKIVGDLKTGLDKL